MSEWIQLPREWDDREHELPAPTRHKLIGAIEPNIDGSQCVVHVGGGEGIDCSLSVQGVLDLIDDEVLGPAREAEKKHQANIAARGGFGDLVVPEGQP